MFHALALDKKSGCLTPRNFVEIIHTRYSGCKCTKSVSEQVPVVSCQQTSSFYHFFNFVELVIVNIYEVILPLCIWLLHSEFKMPLIMFKVLPQTLFAFGFRCKNTLKSHQIKKCILAQSGSLRRYVRHRGRSTRGRRQNTFYVL